MSTRRNKKIVLLVLIFAITVLIIVGTTSALAASDTIVWRFPSLEPGPGYWAPDSIVNFSKAVESRTNGRMKVNVYWGGELGINPPDFPVALQTGAIQAAHGSTAYYAKSIEGCAISAMPMVGIGSYDETLQLHKGLKEFINKDLEEKYRVKILWMVPWEFVQPLTNKKIENYTDLNGMKLRVSGVLTGELIKLSNGVPVSMPLSEVYTSLSKKVIDGAVCSIPILKNASLYEVIDYVYNFYYHSAASIYLVSLDALNSLPEDIRQIVLEEANRVESESIEAASIGMREGLELAKSKNLEIFNPTEKDIDKVRIVVKPIWDEWYQQASPEGQKQFIDALSRTGVTYTP